jgi:exopolysaccharide production protein ExoQ
MSIERVTDDSRPLWRPSRVETAARPTLITLFRRPVWILAGQLGIVLSIVLGMGAFQPYPPTLFVALLLCCVVATVLFGPTRRINRIVVTAPVVALLMWWVASILWTANTFGWRRDTALFVPLAVGLVTIVGLLPMSAVVRGILAGCQVAIAWTVVFTLVNPGEAMVHDQGIPGWTGGFIHKNALAPFMLFAILVAWSFEKNRTRRRLMYAIAFFYIVVSQSTTVLALTVVIIPLGILIRRAARADPASRSTLLATTLAGGAAVTLAAVVTAESVLASRGKDLTFTSRTEIWDGVVRAIEERPITGWGVGGVWVNLGAEPARSILRPLGFPVFHSHNGYLEIALQLGVVGLLLVLLLMGLVLAAGLRELARDVDMGTFMVLFVALVATTSISEVTTMGVWLALLFVLQTLSVRLRRAPLE